MSTVLARIANGLTIVRYCGSEKQQREAASDSRMRFQVSGKNEFNETVKLDLNFEDAKLLSEVLQRGLTI